MKINIEKIRIDGDTQSRVKIHDNIVQEYTESLMNAVVFPPVKLFFDGVDHWLADGFHRYHAHRRAKIKEVDCDISKGTKRDAKLYSWGANNNHGLRRTNEDVRKVVIEALEDIEISTWTNRDIAKLCKTTDMTVGRIKKELQLKDQLEKERKNPKPVIKPAPVATAEDEPEETQDDKIYELSVENNALQAENTRLRDAIAVGKLDLPEEEVTTVEETIKGLRSDVSRLENELQSMTLSRNDFQQKSADAISQVKYWKRRAEKAEKLINKN